ncbi:MAG TPA: hypothetical protein VFP78_08080, partial [Solirubrobacteraceae bacterium]|nr:hypothetical protein [Solirubrobacteraceae bacterium]
MSQTNTNREAPGTVRPLALRDLKFAGTVAAGLVAGVLGVGALSAPLLGWNDWPDALQPGGGADTVQMPPGERATTPTPRRERPRNNAAQNVTTIPGPDGSTLVIAGGGVAGTSVTVSTPG